MKISLFFFFFFIIIFFFFFTSSSSASDVVYNVIELGAKPDGSTDSTNVFLHAWAAACASPTSATISIPRGTYLLAQKTIFQGQCKNTHITIQIDGTLVAPSDYHALSNTENWILFDRVNGVSIVGGTLDGKGTALWACKASGKNCPQGATSLQFSNSKDIAIKGLTSMNSQIFHIVINDCENVNVQGVTITASGNSPNTDGIHVQSSTSVTITRTVIKTGDDCISIGPGTTNLWMEQISCGPGHGISIGSLGKEATEAGVQNVTVKTVAFTNTQNGLRIKTWARTSNGFVKGVLFTEATMNNVQNPIIIDQNYCPHNENCPNQVSGVKISEVTYKNIKGTSATQVAVKFDCSTKNPCNGIILEDLNLTYGNQLAKSSCTSADGSAYGVVKPSSCLL